MTSLVSYLSNPQQISSVLDWHTMERGKPKSSNLDLLADTDFEMHSHSLQQLEYEHLFFES